MAAPPIKPPASQPRNPSRPSPLFPAPPPQIEREEEREVRNRGGVERKDEPRRGSGGRRRA